MASGTLALHILQPNIPRFDLHRAGGHVQLNADQSGHLAPAPVVVDDLAHHVAVHDLDNRIAPRNDMDVVPVARFDEFLELFAVAERADRAPLAAVPDVTDLPAQRQEAPAALFVDLAGETLLGVDVHLVALQHPAADRGQLDAAVL